MTSNKSGLKTILTIIALIFFNIVIVLGPFLGLIGLLIGLYGISIGFTFGGSGLLLTTIISPFFPSNINIAFHPITSISIGISLAALGSLLGIASFYLSKLLYKAIVKYFNWNMDIIKS